MRRKTNKIQSKLRNDTVINQLTFLVPETCQYLFTEEENKLKENSS